MQTFCEASMTSDVNIRSCLPKYEGVNYLKFVGGVNYRKYAGGVNYPKFVGIDYH